MKRDIGLATRLAALAILILGMAASALYLYAQRQYLQFAATGDLTIIARLQRSNSLLLGSCATMVVVSALLIWLYGRQQQMQQDLALSEAQLRHLVDTMPVMLEAANDQGRIVVWNQACESVTGYSADAILNHPDPLSLLYPDGSHRDSVFSRPEERAHGPVLRELTCADGSKRTIAWRQLTSEPRPADWRYVGLGHDVTPLLEAQRELAAARDRYQLLVDNQTDLIARLGPQGEIRFASPSFCAFASRSEKELMGLSVLDLVSRHGGARIMAGFSGMTRDNPTATLEMPVPTRNGVRVIAWAATAIFDSDSDQPGSFVVLGRDITERSQAQEALAESQRQLSTLMANLPGMAYRCDNDADWTMRFVSEGCSELTGYPSESLLDNRDVSYASLIDPLDRAMVRQKITAAIDQEEPFELLYRIRASDGETRWVWEKGRAVSSTAGRVVALEGFVTDISQRIRLEQQLRQSQKLEVVGRLAGGIAHDFNNLLTVINGYTQIALDTLGSQHALFDDLTEVRNAGQRAADLTRRLLAFSRREPARKRPVDLNVVIRDVQGMVERLVGPQIAIALELAPDLASVIADPGQIERVLLNLATNARDAMPQGGRIALWTHEITEECERDVAGGTLMPGRYVRLSVVDSGEGISLEARDHLFEPFYTTKEVGKGTGLGLAMVYGIVQELGGVIDVHGAPKEGTRFEVYLPAADSVAASTGSRPQGGVAKGSATILLVEPDEQVCTFGGNMLKHLGYTVIAAWSVAQAIEACHSQSVQPDLILIDAGLGDEAQSSLQAALSSRDFTPHLIETRDEERRAGNGEVQSLAKPFTLSSLSREVRRALRD